MLEAYCEGTLTRIGAADALAGGTFDCCCCGAAMFLKAADSDCLAPHFAHYEGLSCEGDFDGERTHEENQKADADASFSAWLGLLTVDACHQDSCGVCVSKGLRVDVRDGSRVVFVQRGPIGASEIAFRETKARGLGLMPTWVFRAHGSRFFDDHLYDGSRTRTVSVQPFRVASCGEVFVDVGVRGKLMRLRRFTDGCVYHGRDGAYDLVDSEPAIREILGGALRVPSVHVADRLGRHQPAVYGERLHPSWMCWQSWRRGANHALGRTDLDSGNDARALWIEYVQHCGGVLPKREPKLLACGVQLGAEQRALVRMLYSAPETTILQAPAGAGKSELLHVFANAIESMGFGVMVLGSTNRAANALLGTTLHSACGVKQQPWLSPLLTYEICKDLSELKEARMLAASWVLVDEHSMLKPEDVRMLSESLTFVRQGTSSFGGSRVIFSGDVNQLPAVSCVLAPRFFFDACLSPAEAHRKARSKLHDTHFKIKQEASEIFKEAERHDRDTWENAAESVLQKAQWLFLETNYRQKDDPVLAKILAELCSTGSLGLPSRKILAQSFRTDLGEGVARVLAFKNETVKKYNDQLLGGCKRVRFMVKSRLFGQEVHAKKTNLKRRADADDDESEQAEHWFDNEWDNLKKTMCEDDGAFELGVGKPVLLLHECAGLCKHTTATFLGGSSTHALIEVAGVQHEVPVHTETHESGLASFSYIPLLRVSACTVHKSQGLTIRAKMAIVIDPVRGSSAWPENMAYTALSRASSLADVSFVYDLKEVQSSAPNRRRWVLDDLIKDVFRINPRVVDEMIRIRKAAS